MCAVMCTIFLLVLVSQGEKGPQYLNFRIFRQTEIYQLCEEWLNNKIIKEVDTTRLRNYHKELTKAPHIAGLQRDQELTGWIKKVKAFAKWLCMKTWNVFLVGTIHHVFVTFLGMDKRRS